MAHLHSAADRPVDGASLGGSHQHYRHHEPPMPSIEDVERSPDSVRHAMAELQLKTKLLEEERDYYTSLSGNSRRAFEEHRVELTALLAKEREYFRRREETLQNELQVLLGDNSTLQAKSSEVRAQAAARLNSELKQFQHESLLKEGQYRRDIQSTHDELIGVRRELAIVLAAADALRRSLDTSRVRQETLQRNVIELTAENQRLVNSLGRPPPQSGDASMRGLKKAPTKVGTRKIALPFVPSSGTAALANRNATHNAHALVQTIRKHAFADPTSMQPTVPHHHRPSAPEMQIDTLCRTVISEIAELRSQYDTMSRCLADPANAGPEIGQRLRELFEHIDAKTRQLRSLRASQRQLDSGRRLDEALADAEHQASAWMRKHDKLMAVIHSSSFDPADVGPLAITDSNHTSAAIASRGVSPRRSVSTTRLAA